MIEACRSFIALLAAVILALGGSTQPDVTAELAGSQWVDEDGWVYEFNEDDSLFTSYELGFIYGRMTTGEYRQAWITSEGELLYELDETTYSFATDGEELLLNRYDGGELAWTQRFLPHSSDAGTPSSAR